MIARKQRGAILRPRRLGLALLTWCTTTTTSAAQTPTAEHIKSALVDLAPRFAQEFSLRPGWYRGQQIRYYDVGPVKSGVADVYWPIHGFGLNGEPVPLRGQKPVFSTIPGLDGYTSLWTMHYVVVADHALPNTLRTVAQITRLVQQKRAVLRDANLTLNLPIVARGSYLEGKRDAPQSLGWFEGNEVAYFDFGIASTVAAPIYPFFRSAPADQPPVSVEGQRNVVDVIPNGTAPSVDLWDVHLTRVDSAYAANTITSLSALLVAERDRRLTTTKAGSIRNCPVALLGDTPVPRLAGPLTLYAIPARP